MASRQAPASSAGTKTAAEIPAKTTSEGHSSETAQAFIPDKLGGPVPWSTDLCDCFSDLESCCLTLWCPCITFGLVSEIVDRGSSSCVLNCLVYSLIAYVTGCQCLYSYCYRSKMREQYSLEEDPCPDCPVHCFCEPCALCQEYRELKNRGFNMHIGWQKNMERQNKGVQMAPVVEGGMSR